MTDEAKAPPQFYRLSSEKEHGGEKWAHIEWIGSFPADVFKALMAEVFNELKGDAVYSYETKRFYVKKDALDRLDFILAFYGDKFTPSASEEKAVGLDKAFSAA